MATTFTVPTRRCYQQTEIQDEIRVLETLWETGKLHRHLRSLERFYREKRPEFLTLLSNEPASRRNLVELAKQLVIQHGIIDHLAETLDQIKEIESEIWIQGENGNRDREAIAAEWTERHAARWREWRIKEYLFATEHMEDRLHHCFYQAS